MCVLLRERVTELEKATNGAHDWGHRGKSQIGKSLRFVVQWSIERATPGQKVMGLIPVAGARSLLVGLASI